MKAGACVYFHPIFITTCSTVLVFCKW